MHMLRSLPLDTNWYVQQVDLRSIASWHIMCEKVMLSVF